MRLLHYFLVNAFFLTSFTREACRNDSAFGPVVWESDFSTKLWKKKTFT